MNPQFIKGRNLLTAIIVFQLLFSLLGLYLYSSGTIYGYLAQELATIPDAPIESPQLLESQLRAASKDSVIQQGISFGMVTFWCILLYFGINWVRLLSGVSWLLSGLFGLIAGFVIYNAGYFTELILPSVIIWLLYAFCGGMLLFSPSIRTYARMMRS
jgi:small-conductance mechanosensitive channel